MHSDQAAGILQFLLFSVEREHGTTKRVIAAIPAGKSSFTPDAKSMTADALAWHIASSEQMFMNFAITGELGGPSRPDAVQTPADIVAWYEAEWTANVARLKQMAGDQLARIIDFHGVFQAPAVTFIQLMLSHSIHHRGQLSTYLRPMGAKVPSIYGPSGDEGMPSPKGA